MNKLRVLMEQPPPARGDAEQQVAELRTYISRMVEELQFLFEHMDARATDYDPFDSGLLARNTQDAIDELTAGVQNVPTPYPNNPAMDGTAYPGASNSYARGDHVHPTDTNLVPISRTVNGKALNGNISLSAADVGARASSWTPSAADVGAIPATEKGAASGVASLGSDGKVPSGQLPTIPTQATVTPLMDGTGYVGDSTKYAREDHVHPRDINKQNKILASGILKGDGDGGVSAAAGGTDYADPEQLAYVETGATATKTGGYTAGDYICWQGKQYTADTNIAYGTAFYTSGGGKNLTECPGGGFNSLHQKTKDFVKIATYTTGGNYPLAYSSYSEFILVFVLAGSVRLAEYVPASLFSVGSRWRITQDGAAYFDVLFNSGDTIACQVSNGTYSGSFGEIWAR